MNASSFGAILRDTTAVVRIAWQMPATFDGYQMRVAAYEAGPDGIPMYGGDTSMIAANLDGRLFAQVETRGGGALLSTIRHMMDRAVRDVLDTHHLRRIVRRIDAALFALDHDGGHGVEVERGVRELWTASGADTWKAYATKREEVLRWLEVFAKESP